MNPMSDASTIEKVLLKHNQWVLGEDFQKIWNRGNYQSVH